MQSICIAKSKEYYIIADGTQEYLVYRSREEAESFVELFKNSYKNKTVIIKEAIVLTSYTMDEYVIKESEE